MTQDNVFSWGRMLEFRDFMAQFGFPFPLFCAVLSVIGQFGGGLALVLRACSRVFAGIGDRGFNFIIAIWMVDVEATLSRRIRRAGAGRRRGTRA